MSLRPLVAPAPAAAAAAALLLLIAAAAAAPLTHHAARAEGAAVGERLPLALHAARADGGAGAVAAAERLPLPSAQELQAIRKVAQILAMLGEQVIPAILGEQQLAECEPPPEPPAAAPAPLVAPLDAPSTHYSH